MCGAIECTITIGGFFLLFVGSNLYTMVHFYISSQAMVVTETIKYQSKTWGVPGKIMYFAPDQ